MEKTLIILSIFLTSAPDRHWWWAGGYETGYVNHSAQLFSKVTELQNGHEKHGQKTINVFY